MAIKDEVGGNSGYLKKVRNYFLPSSKEMAELAFERYQTTLGVEITKEYALEHTDDILKGLFEAETEIFAEKNSSILSSALPYYLKKYIREKISDIQKPVRILNVWKDFLMSVDKIVLIWGILLARFQKQLVRLWMLSLFPRNSQLNVESEIHCKIIYKLFLKNVIFQIANNNRERMAEP